MPADYIPELPEGLFKDLDYAGKLQEQQEAYQKKIRELLISFLPIKDTLEALYADAVATTNSSPQIDQHWCDRLALLDKQLAKAFSKAGVTEIESVGHTADPHLHHVVDIETAPEEDAEKIVRESVKGYYYKDQLLRRPEVVVGKNK